MKELISALALALVATPALAHKTPIVVSHATHTEDVAHELSSAPDEAHKVRIIGTKPYVPEKPRLDGGAKPLVKPIAKPGKPDCDKGSHRAHGVKPIRKPTGKTTTPKG